MMLKLFGIGALASALMPGTSVAHGVDFRAFDTVQHSFVLGSVRPEPTERADSRQPEPLPLAIDFIDLGRIRSEVTVATSKGGSGATSVPRWTHIGHRPTVATGPRYLSAGPARRSSSSQGDNLPSGCSHQAYRPKGLQLQVEERRSRYYSLMVETACSVGVPVTLFDALITQESGYNPAAISVKGAIGMSQLMPATARFAGVINPWNVAQNLRGGAQVLKMHLAEFGRYDLALAAYNAGAGRVRQKGRVPRIKETTNYVSTILSDVRRQYAQAIGFAGSAAVTPQHLQNASLMRF